MHPIFPAGRIRGRSEAARAPDFHNGVANLLSDNKMTGRPGRRESLRILRARVGNGGANPLWQKTLGGLTQRKRRGMGGPTQPDYLEGEGNPGSG